MELLLQIILIIFSLTVAIATKSRSITALTQEMGMMKLQIYKLTTVLLEEKKAAPQVHEKGTGY